MDTLDANHQMLLREFRNVHWTIKEQSLSSAPSFTTPALAPFSTPHPKIAELLNFKRTVKRDLFLKQWLQCFGIWAHYKGITYDKMCIIMALIFLNSGTIQFIDDYVWCATAGLPLGTWSDFES